MTRELTGTGGLPSIRLQDMIADNPALSAAAAHLALTADAYESNSAGFSDLQAAVVAWRAVFRPLLTGSADPK